MKFLKKLWDRFWYPETTKLFKDWEPFPPSKGTAGGCNCQLPKFMGVDLAQGESETNESIILYDEHGRIISLDHKKVTK